MNDSFLSRSNVIYKELVKHVSRTSEGEQPESVLQLVENIANLAWKVHPGRFADGQLENIAFQIGEELGSYFQQARQTFNLPKFKRPSKKHVLHVATDIFHVGGHTRLINNWIKNDVSTVHSVVLVNQKSPTPQWLVESVTKSGGHFIVFPKASSLITKSQWLRRIASEVDGVILHHHPDDVVPIIAFADKKNPPVGILNHADHVFWLGSSIADVIINLRPSGRDLSKARRFSRNNTILPIPLTDRLPEISKKEARQKLGLKDTDVMLLSIGSEYKYVPNKKYNFYSTVSKILDKNPNTHLFLIGVPSNSDKAYVKKAMKNSRFKCMGVIEDPSLYQIASDIYLEGFPFGSLTAMLEPALLGVPPVFPYAPESQVMMGNDVALNDKVYQATDEADYIAHVSSLIQDQEKRRKLGSEIRREVDRSHAGQGWLNYLKITYNVLFKTTHNPKRLPNAPFLKSCDDISLAKFNTAQIKDPILFRFADNYLSQLSFLNLLKWFFISIKCGDVKSLTDFRKWLSLMIEKMDKNESYPKLKQALSRLFHFNTSSSGSV